MSVLKTQDQGTIILDQQDYLAILIESFLRVKAPKLSNEPIEPINLQDINLLLKTCEGNFSGLRDKAMMVELLDTGARAKEFLNINLEDIELATGSVLIRQGKGRKPRLVFMGRKTIRAIHAYLRARHDTNPALGFQFMKIE